MMKVRRYVAYFLIISSFSGEIEFAFDLGVDENEQAFDSVYIHIYK